MSLSSERSHNALLLAGVTGALVGLVVAGFEWITAEVALERVQRLPIWAQVGLPALGLVAAGVALRFGGLGGPERTPATADEYIRDFHAPGDTIRPGDIPWKLLAAVFTLGTGGPLGYEGPSVYAGAGIGATIQHRLRRWFTPADRNLLLVSGAAAGVSAIFKAPVTGLVFALEVPYQEDLARHMVLPAAMSAAASYVTFAALTGTEPLLAISGQPPFDLRDLGGAAAVGVVCGILARSFARLVRLAKDASVRGHPAVRIPIAGTALAACVLAGHAIGDASLVTGPGYDAIRWAIQPERAVAAIIALGTLKVAATAIVLGGGGVGGLFIPLVVQGALVGSAIGKLVESPNATLFPVVGMAAFLGSGYRVPLAAVVFVAEFTGRATFVVPGLIAAVLAQLAAGRSSVSSYQRAHRGA